jgi:hypothetical protein
MSDDKSEAVQSGQSENKIPDFTVADDFLERYANHVYFEPNFWDMKLLFGSYDQSVHPNHVNRHTAISIPWFHVKMISYLLQVHLIQYEATVGKVRLVPGFIAPAPELSPEDEAALSPEFHEVYVKTRKLYQDFRADNPEAFRSEK